MSLSGISSSSLFSYETQGQNQNKLQQFQREFQQLGKDLQSGNLSAAQTDFATLQQMAPQGTSSTSSTSSNPLQQAFQHLGQDLQSGNLSSAQQAYTTLQQEIQQLGGNNSSTPAEGTAISGVSVSA